MIRVALACLVGFCFETPYAATFEDPLCDQKASMYSNSAFLTDTDGKFGGRPYSVSILWSEPSLNPLTTPLDVQINLYFEMGDPILDAFNKIASEVRDAKSCTTGTTFHSFNRISTPNEIGFDARVDVDYNVCAGNEYLYRQGGQVFKFGARITAAVESNVPLVRTRTFSDTTEFPQELRVLGQLFGGLIGGLFGQSIFGAGLPFGVLGAAKGEEAVQKSYDEAFDQFKDALASFNTTEKIGDASLAALVSDYRPRFDTPIFGGLRKSQSEIYNVLIVPMRVSVPPGQNCAAKKAIRQLMLNFRKGKSVAFEIYVP